MKVAEWSCYYEANANTGAAAHYVKNHRREAISFARDTI